AKNGCIDNSLGMWGVAPFDRLFIRLYQISEMRQLLSQKSQKKGWNDSTADYIGRLAGVVMPVREKGSGWP
ncbi:hypothetical protein, partial [Aeromonas veronii]|uniref:hypothetical protein n=1 Tax=Aeromonas veronii TaxID=654 RepID=UPI0038B5DBA3